MFKYRVGLGEDSVSNAMAKNIEDMLREGKTVHIRKLSGVVDAVAWPTMPDGKKDRTGYCMLLMSHGNFWRILYRTIMSRITNTSYVEFGWGNVEFTDD